MACSRAASVPMPHAMSATWLSEALARASVGLRALGLRCGQRRDLPFFRAPWIPAGMPERLHLTPIFAGLLG